MILTFIVHVLGIINGGKIEKNLDSRAKRIKNVKKKSYFLLTLYINIKIIHLIISLLNCVHFASLSGFSPLSSVRLILLISGNSFLINLKMFPIILRYTINNCLIKEREDSNELVRIITADLIK